MATSKPEPTAQLSFRPGKRTDHQLRVARGPSGEWITMPAVTLCGTTDGPTVWLSAAIHGDEINGVEIIRQVTNRLSTKTLSGRVIAVPIVNVFGFTTGDRYLPDRRDLNRCFPGSKTGSLGGQLANLFVNQIVSHSDVGIDLHTGSAGRFNLPQIRADLDDERTRTLARAFGAPVMIHSRVRDGSLRETAARRGTSVLLYEAGEANRFDADSIELGARGVFRVLESMGMTEPDGLAGFEHNEPVTSRETRWIRAPRSGILRSSAAPGDLVNPSQQMGVIADPFGGGERIVRSRVSGVVIGRAEEPVVHRGDALFHIARVTGR